ncbi:DNA-binding protein [Candidatus Arthromitus sp. SFB-rat-Yit]|uniref:DNA-binding protein n=1 Tax=Candidatus Arthromitus sp. SFB-rat-Yit TaxID=1041504 RepID=UPI000227A6E6|nr:DNA-binding protein [Candidatus Arthromitus sp. SFB-rat-Yit]BAK81125.1 putative DNA-binding protein [Candidatus Arthromitus sp. SFB-rat-Yit]
MDKKDLKNRNEIILLIDIYGDLLTEKQKKILELYFFDDLALVEIASINESSRQSILYSINKSIEQLYAFENKLKILERDMELNSKKKELIEKLEEFLDFGKNQELYNFIQNL